MICQSCNKDSPRIIKHNCSACYNRHYQKNKRKIQKEKNKIILTNLQKQILTGLMLGDGCIQFASSASTNPRLTITRSVQDKDYMLWIYNHLKNICSSQPFEYEVFDKRTNKNYCSINLQSKSLECLKQVREDWYPNKIKTVSKDLELTDLTLLIWFLDDGSFINRGSKFEIKLSTHGFHKDDVMFLSKLLSLKFKSHFRVHNDNNHYYIAGSSKSAILFIKEINSIFPQCMDRKKKWNDLILDQQFNSSKMEKINKYNYQICRFIVDNNYNKFTSVDIASKYNWFKPNGSPNGIINSYLNSFEKDGLLSIIGRSFKREIVFDVTLFGKQEFKSILDRSKKYLDGYGLL